MSWTLETVLACLLVSTVFSVSFSLYKIKLKGGGCIVAEVDFNRGGRYFSVSFRS